MIDLQSFQGFTPGRWGKMLFSERVGIPVYRVWRGNLQGGPSLPGSASIGLFGEAEPQGLLPLKSQKLDFGVIRVQVVADEALAEMRAVAAMYGFVPSVRPPLKRPRPPLSLSGLSEFESRKRAHKRI